MCADEASSETKYTLVGYSFERHYIMHARIGNLRPARVSGLFQSQLWVRKTRSGPFIARGAIVHRGLLPLSFVVFSTHTLTEKGRFVSPLAVRKRTQLALQPFGLRFASPAASAPGGPATS